VSVGELGGAGAPKPRIEPLPVWDLNQICAGPQDALAQLETVTRRVAEFATTYRGHVDRLDAAQLRRFLDDYSGLVNMMERPQWYAHLRMALDVESPVNRGLLEKVNTRITDLANELLFVDLEWQALPPDRAQALARDQSLAPYRHYLENLTEAAGHMLSEGQERMAAMHEDELGLWDQLYESNLAGIRARIKLGDRERVVGLEELLALRWSPSAVERHVGIDRAIAHLKKRADISARVYNAMIKSRLNSDKLRGFGSPMEAANLDNELDDRVVDDLIGSVVSNYSLGQRWLQLKAKLAGKDVLSFYDQYIPIGSTGECSFGDAKRDIMAATTRFSPEYAAIIEEFFRTGRIDAAPRRGKTGGAFCSSGPTDGKPMILLNYTDGQRDEITAAHELGHGVHAVLASAAQPVLTYHPGMAMAEVASTFGEMIQFEYLLNKPGLSNDERLSLLVSRLDDSCATIFRQVMMARFEQRAYAHVASGEALTAEVLGKFWQEENALQYGDALRMPDSGSVMWAYVSHFIGTRFYTYSYSFAHLASLALFAKYHQALASGDGQEFADRYMGMLADGGSKTPEQLLGEMGIDINDPHWVDAGFAVFEEILNSVEQLAGLGRQDKAA
jgi:oligoendopeptidase F